MKKHFLRTIATLAIAWSVGACATIVGGTHQAINVDSDPTGANCVMTRDGVQLQALVTPAQVTVKQNQQAIQVRCRKEGYEEASALMNVHFEVMSAGNLVLGGVVGVMVDAASGANAKYDSSVMVSLRPLSEVDRVAEVARRAQEEADKKNAPTPPPAKTYTGPWTADTVIIADKSAGSCRGSTPYSFDLADQTFKGANESGQMFSVPLAADGTVDTTFRSSTGNVLQIVGNARTRDLTLVNDRSGCRWKLVPQ